MSLGFRRAGDGDGDDGPENRWPTRSAARSHPAVSARLQRGSGESNNQERMMKLEPKWLRA